MNRPETAKPTTKPIGEVRHVAAQAEKASSCDDLLEQILERDNLLEAWKRVRSNEGAPGIDGMTVGAFPAFCREHWPRIRTALEEGTYRPAAVRRVEIPKPDGGKRPLGVPTWCVARGRQAG